MLATAVKNKDILAFPFGGLNQSLPSAYLQQLSINYDVRHGIEFHHSIVEIANIHKKNPNGAKFIYYGNPIGNGVVRLFFPSDNNDFAIDSYLQNIKSEEILTAFNKAVIWKENIILEYKPQYSSPHRIDSPAQSSQFIFYVILATNKFTENAQKELIEEIANLSVLSVKKLRWVVYQELNTHVFHVLIPFNTYKEIEETFTSSAISKIRMSNAYVSIDNYQTYLLSHVPNCGNSNSECSTT